MTRSLWTAAVLAGLVALTGCADLGYLGNGRYDDYDRGSDGYYGDRGRYDGDYRRVERDASVYANEIDRYVGVSNREERAIRDVLLRLTYRQLDRGGAYPFPRRRGYAERFWRQADRDIERVLDRRYREPYRYYNRYGAQRYREYYRHRRYDDRRGWYDARRYDDGRRDRREDRRDARDDRREDRRDDRQETRRDRQDDRRDARRDRRGDRQETRRDRRGDRRDDRQDRRDERREAQEDRRDDARRTAPSRRDSAEQARESRQEQRRRDRRRDGN